jgi:hypothetical protein
LRKELVFVRVYRLGFLVFSPEKAIVEEVERGREKVAKTEEASFFAVYEPKFLLSQAIKSNSIYRSWKRVILSSLRKHFGP